MAEFQDSIAYISALLSEALSLLSECVLESEPPHRRRYVEIAAQLTKAKFQISQPPIAEGVSPKVESEVQRTHRKAAEDAQRVEDMLNQLNLSKEEQDFSKQLGENLVVIATNSYLSARNAASVTLQDSCITAAVAVALMIVHDAPE